METIIKYKSNDGIEWDNQSDAEKRDALCMKVDAVMLPLGKVPEGVTAGKGWLQHDLETINQAKDAILEICREQGYDKSYPSFKERGRNCHPLSFIGRVLDDNGGPLNTAWSRFARIDVQGREHQQCYYAYTGGPARDHVCIESRVATSVS